MKRNGQRDCYFDLLLLIRLTQREEFEMLDPSLKLKALEYGARLKEKDLMRGEENKKSAADEDIATRRAF
ncbi:MAG: hypothetical protein H0W99_07355 [Acidobacteria bacterium]|nr:hypothetical protein [Acidobacteriota bacterium]